MKVLLIGFLLACTIKMTKASSEFTAILTHQESKYALDLMNSSCEKQWCDGRYDFQFQSIVCDEVSATCRVKFKILDRAFIPGKFSEINSSCLFENIYERGHVLSKNGLNKNFLNNLDACLTLVVE